MLIYKESKVAFLFKNSIKLTYMSSGIENVAYEISVPLNIVPLPRKIKIFSLSQPLPPSLVLDIQRHHEVSWKWLKLKCKLLLTSPLFHHSKLVCTVANML